MKELKGECLCGAVKIVANSESNKVHACHCDMCRKWGGSALMSINVGTDVKIEGEENVSVFDSSDWAERGFCKKCGTHIFYRVKQNQFYIIAPGLFDDESGLAFDEQLFIDKKPEYYTFVNETTNLTEQQVFEKFG